MTLTVQANKVSVAGAIEPRKDVQASSTVQTPKLNHKWKYVHGRWTDGDEVAYKFRCELHPKEVKVEVGHPNKELIFEARLNSDPLLNETNPRDQELQQRTAFMVQL
ncbi:MAG: hypothetical protein KGH94_04230 [Candidatus Micrarchaeota archaeon]|nr:hypothetical protein [Candidatus Micrarchaeota archaeon]